MRKIFILVFIFVFSLAVYGQSIQDDLENIKNQIKEAEADSAKYAGGLVKALIESRIQMLKNTKAMLEQRIKADDYNIALKYTINGAPFESPKNKDELLKEIEKEALQAFKEKEALQAEADKYSGGLVRATKLSTVAMKEQQIAMLELRRISLLYDIPIFTSPSEQPTRQPEAPAVSTSSQEDINRLITLKLLRKRVFEANYSEHLGMEFEYTNNAEKPIKAFTGIIYFKDVFDREISKVNLTVDKFVINPGQTVKDKNKSIKLNKFSDTDTRLRTINIDNLKVDFEVKAILFTDGTKIGNIE